MLSEGDFKSIRNLILKLVGQQGQTFYTDKVIKRDVPNRCVYLAAFGDQAIPIVGFDYTMDYYDTQSDGSVSKKTATVKVQVPKIGQSVLVAREMGTNRLPRCLGVIQGTNWIVTAE